VAVAVLSLLALTLQEIMVVLAVTVEVVAEPLITLEHQVLAVTE
jgi:hypothetical protein